MDLKIKDVAELLSLSEDTIRRWILDGKIPAYKLNRQYRFSRIEVENWMMQQKLGQTRPQAKASLATEYPTALPQQEVAHPSGQQQYGLFRAINRGGVYLDIQGKNKEEVIRNCMVQVGREVGLDPDVLSELLLDRERMMPTALNNGIAVPHARECLEYVPFDFVTVAFLAKPIAYGALDDKPVDTLFFLFATEDKTHLHLLAKIAHLSSNEEALTFFRKAPDKGKLLEFIRKWESSLRIANLA